MAQSEEPDLAEAVGTLAREKSAAEQYAVVLAPGPVLLSGSAGSGKTTIAVHRLAAAMGTAPVTNTATKTAEVQPDPVAGNNTASATVTGQSADIAITKIVNRTLLRRSGTRNMFRKRAIRFIACNLPRA